MLQHVFYSPERVVALDYAYADESGHWRTVFDQQTLDDVRVAYPDARVTTEREFKSLQHRHACTDPVEITADEYDDALGVMPPLNPTRIPGSASFMLREMYVGSVTTIYVCLESGDGPARCFKFRDKFTLTHRQVLERVERAIHGDQEASHVSDL